MTDKKRKSTEAQDLVLRKAAKDAQWDKSRRSSTEQSIMDAAR